MTENPHVQETTQVQATGTTFPATASAEGAQLNGRPSSGDRAATSECRSSMTACGMGHKGLKGLLLMAACCGAPLLLFLALPVLGSALGGAVTVVVPILAALACPVGMVLMMWLMMRGQQAGADELAHTQPVALPPVTTTAAAGPQEAGELPAGGRYADTSGPAH